jgi:uroporphyrinogen III methyltransferase/synthase
MPEKKGKVYLVGAGPGDIGLFTVKGLRCLQSADVVVYDFHLNAHVLNYINHEAEFIYAGKRGGRHTMVQDEINRVIVEKAREGKRVCRLKGGDPFIFGRGGEVRGGSGGQLRRGSTRLRRHPPHPQEILVLLCRCSRV